MSVTVMAVVEGEVRDKERVATAALPSFDLPESAWIKAFGLSTAARSRIEV